MASADLSPSENTSSEEHDGVTKKTDMEELFHAISFIFHQQDLNDKQKNVAIEELVYRKRKLCIMVFGLMGIGKSTLLNGIIGTHAFEVGYNLDHQTPTIEKQTLERGVYTLIACDTPGLNDSTGKKDEYISEIGVECKGVDVFLYCIKVTSIRVNEDVLKKNSAIIKELEKKVDAEVWEHCIIVLTFANSIVLQLQQGRKNVKKEFNISIEEWKKRVRNMLCEANIRPTRKIPIVPTGVAKKPSLLDDLDYWMSDLFNTVYETVSDDGKDVLTHFNKSRIKTRKEANTDKLSVQEPEDIPIVPEKNWLDKLKARFPVIAAAVGAGGVAGATGATIGATIGALAIGIPTFGVAAGVGLVLGAAIGGGSGIGIGILTAKAVAKVKRMNKEETCKKD